MGMWSVPGVRASKRDLRDMWRTAMIDMLFNGVGWADIAPSRAPRSGVIVGRLVWAIGKGACRLMLYLATKDGEPVPSRAPPNHLNPMGRWYWHIAFHRGTLGPGRFAICEEPASWLAPAFAQTQSAE
jgi:hypothetical protein